MQKKKERTWRFDSSSAFLIFVLSFTIVSLGVSLFTIVNGRREAELLLRDLQKAQRELEVTRSVLQLQRAIVAKSGDTERWEITVRDGIAAATDKKLIESRNGSIFMTPLGKNHLSQDLASIVADEARKHSDKQYMDLIYEVVNSLDLDRITKEALEQHINSPELLGLISAVVAEQV